jgi:hypothetical protein
VTTPREQLIEAMCEGMTSDAVYAKASDKNTWDSGSAQFDWSALAEGAFQALSDLGAVVLMPVNKADVPDSTGLVYELHDTVGGHVQSLWPVSFNGARHATVYVMALKGEQS